MRTNKNAVLLLFMLQVIERTFYDEHHTRLHSVYNGSIVRVAL